MPARSCFALSLFVIAVGWVYRCLCAARADAVPSASVSEFVSRPKKRAYGVWPIVARGNQQGSLCLNSRQLAIPRAPAVSTFQRFPMGFPSGFIDVHKLVSQSTAYLGVGGTILFMGDYKVMNPTITAPYMSMIVGLYDATGAVVAL